MTNWRQELAAAEYISCDIETAPHKCFGFATSPSQSYVIPFHKKDLIREVCASSTPKIWANGKFDLYVLKYVWGIDVAGPVHDVMAAWFALYPELAGAKEDKKKRKMTRKSLAFLSSIFTLDAWWKGDYSTLQEFYEYNGKDCCITFDVFEKLMHEVKVLGVESSYDHVRSLIWPCVDMLARGMAVDEPLRLQRLEELTASSVTVRAELNKFAQPLLKKTSSPLFQKKEGVCKCCRHAKKKQKQCWSCSGFKSAPSKTELAVRINDTSWEWGTGRKNAVKATKTELEEAMLSPCTVCSNLPRREWLEWNPGSHDQNKVLLYDLLKLPRRTKKGKLRSDEEALKSLLGVAKKQEQKDLLLKLLSLGKIDTMQGIYKRIAPASDGRIHSDQSPYGTETSRFSHSETFLLSPGSTNLANLPKKTALKNPLYSVRDCIIAGPGRRLLKADYSAAEARWCAWMAQDTERIAMYNAGVDQYKLFVALLKWDDESRISEVTKVERDALGKVGILSGQYGAQWRTLLDAVNNEADLTGIAIDKKTAQKMEDIWPQRFPKTIEWHGEVREEVLSKGCLTNPLGFRRDFFARRDTDRNIDSLVREAIAFGPQSANAWLLNQCLRELYQLHDPGLLRILLQVHDEIVLDCAPRDIPEVVRSVKAVMEKVLTIHGRRMLIPAEIEVGKTWSQTKQIA